MCFNQDNYCPTSPCIHSTNPAGQVSGECVCRDGLQQRDMMLIL